MRSSETRLQSWTIRGPNPLFVVATQCIEAGADFDFDGLVAQIAPLDALAQRFGRLARAGDRGSPAPATIVALPEDIAKKTDDPIYGDRMRLTWEWLGRQDMTADGAIDLGPGRLADLIAADPVGADACRAEAPNAPLLRAADVDFLSMTNPALHPDPLLPLFLHGDQRIETDVAIVWRTDLSEEDLVAEPGETPAAADIVAAMPPRPGEAVAVPIAARRWLRGLAGPAPALADVPQRDAEEDGGGGASRKALRWRRQEPDVVTASQIRPGDTLIVPAMYGGCDDFGWNPGSDAKVEDIADLAALPYRDRDRGFSVRVQSAVWPDLPDGPGWDEIVPALIEGSEGRPGARRLLEVVKAELPGDRTDPGTPNPEPPSAAALARASALTALREVMGRKTAPQVRVAWPYGDVEGAPAGAVIVVGEAPVESDDSDAATFTGEQPLGEHIAAVEAWTSQSATALRLPAPVAEALRLAASRHDDGKADERFQAYLGRSQGESLGKSDLKRSRREDGRAWIGAGFPDLPPRRPAASRRAAPGVTRRCQCASRPRASPPSRGQATSIAAWRSG